MEHELVLNKAVAALHSDHYALCLYILYDSMDLSTYMNSYHEFGTCMYQAETAIIELLSGAS